MNTRHLLAVLLAVALPGIASAITVQPATYRVTVSNPNETAIEFYVLYSDSVESNNNGAHGPFMVPAGATAHEIDATIPAGDKSESSTHLYTLEGAWFTVPFTGNGASYVATGPLDVTVDQFGSIAEGTTILNFDIQLPFIRVLTPEGKKTLWMSSSSTLDGALFREGIDKVIAFQSEGTGTSGGSGDGVVDKLEQIRVNQVERDPYERNSSAAATTAFNTAMTDMLATKDSASTELAGLFGAGESEAGTLTAPAAPADEFTIATFPTVLETTFKIQPFVSIPTLREHAHLIREALLWGLVFSFMWYSRRLLEKYMLSFLGTPQIGTKTESAQIAVPGIGWGKQASVAAGYILVTVAAIAGTVALMNTQIGTLFAGVEIGTVASTAGGFWSSISTASGVLGSIFSFVGEFVPFAAMFQLIVAEMVFGWSLPALWMVAYSYAKVVNP